MKTTFYIFRHGETEAKKQNPPLVCGRFDSPLSEEGKKQIAEKIAPVIADIDFDAVFLSPTTRSRESYEAAFSSFAGAHPEVKVVEDLREVDYGEYDGKPADEYDKAKKEWKAAGNELNFHTKLGGGESNAEAAERFEKALLRIAGENPGKTVLLPSHNGVMRALFFLGKIKADGANIEAGKDLPFGSLLVLKSDGESLEFVDFVY